MSITKPVTNVSRSACRATRTRTAASPHISVQPATTKVRGNPAGEGRVAQCGGQTDRQSWGSYSPLCAAVLQTGLKTGRANIVIVPAVNGKTQPTFRKFYKYNRRKPIPCYSAANITRLWFYSGTNKTERKMAQHVVTFHGLQEHRRQTADRTKGWHSCSTIC